MHHLLFQSLCWVTCIFFLPWPRTPGLQDYWNVCTILKHLFKSCFSLKGKCYSQIQSQIKKTNKYYLYKPLRPECSKGPLGAFPSTPPFFWHLDKQCGAFRQCAAIRVYNPFKFTGQTGKEGKCQKLQIKQLILKGNEACKWIIFRKAISDFLNICHSWVVVRWSVC